MNKVLDFCHEFGHGDDSNEWKKSTKEAYNDKDFYCNLESKNLSMHAVTHTKLLVGPS